MGDLHRLRGQKNTNVGPSMFRCVFVLPQHQTPINKPFFIIFDPTFTDANKDLEHAVVIDLRKRGGIADVVHKKQ